jgi:hypothetical protein
VLSRIYDPAAFCARVERLIATLNVRPADAGHPTDQFRRRYGIETVRRIVNRLPEYRKVLWQTFLRCHAINPSADPQTVILLSFFLHLGPYARRIIAETKRAIAHIDADQVSCAGPNRWEEPVAVPAVVAEGTGSPPPTRSNAEVNFMMLASNAPTQSLDFDRQ